MQPAKVEPVETAIELPTTDDPETAAIISAYMKVIGTRGGKVSGSKRIENLSDKTRRDIARKAASARWEKKGRP